MRHYIGDLNRDPNLESYPHVAWGLGCCGYWVQVSRLHITKNTAWLGSGLGVKPRNPYASDSEAQKHTKAEMKQCHEAKMQPR